MNRDDPLDSGGLPDPGGTNISYTDSTPFEPTDEQLELIQTDLKTIADGIRMHLTDGFTVTTRVARTHTGPMGVVVVAFPTGETIGPGIELTADMFEAADESNWNGPISPDEIETLSHEITTMTLAQWAKMTGFDSDDQDFPAQ